VLCNNHLKTLQMRIFISLLLCIFFFACNRDGLLNDAVTDQARSNFFSRNFIVSNNPNVVSTNDQSEKTKTVFQNNSASSELDAEVDKITGKIDLLLNEAKINEITAIGWPVWEMAQRQGSENDYTFVVPLIKESSSQLEGVLYAQVHFDKFVGIMAAPRDFLLTPLAEGRPCNSWDESLKMYDVAIFDVALFDHHFLPKAYASSFLEEGYKENFNQASAGDKNFPEIKFIRDCTSITISFQGQSITRFECTSRTIINGGGGTVIVPTGSNGGGGGSSPNPSDDDDDDSDDGDDDEEENLDYCLWTVRLAEVFSGSQAPAQDVRYNSCTVFSDILLDAIGCNGSVNFHYEGECGPNVDVRDEGTRIFPPNPRHSNVGSALYSLRICNNSSAVWQIAPIGLGYEWETFAGNSCTQIYKRYLFTVGENRNCYDACSGI